MSRLAVAFLLAFASGAVAQTLPEGDYRSLEVADFKAGIFCAQKVIAVNPAPGTIAGVTNVIEGEPGFISVSRRVPAVIGVGFGVKVRVDEPFGYDDVRITVTHPPMGPDGIATEQYTSAISGAILSMNLFQFDFDYELVPGIWSIEADWGGKPVYRAVFEVAAARDVPELAVACGYADQLS